MSTHLTARVHRRVATRRTATAVVLGLLATIGGGLQSASAQTVDPIGRVVTNGLDNPRGLTFYRGNLYIAEAGHGGPTCFAGGEEGTTCVGLTGKISRISGGHLDRVTSGLISLAGPDGSFALGMVSVSGRFGKLYGQFSGNTDGIPPAGLPAPVLKAAKSQLGQLVRATGRSIKATAGVGDFDFAWTDDHQNLVPGQFPDSNPNAVLAAPGGAYVADAGANTLDWVSDGGKVRILAFFGVPAGSPTDAVPTCVAKGPDGAIYVGELLGGNFAPGHARVWRYAEGKGTVWKSGFTTIQGCGFDSRGNFYATEFATAGLGGSSPAGDIVKIARDGTRSVIGAGQLSFPSGFASRSNRIYVSNWSVMPAVNASGPTGQLIRFTIP